MSDCGTFSECELLVRSLKAAVEVIERMHERGIHEPDRFAQIIAFSFGASLKVAAVAQAKGLVQQSDADCSPVIESLLG